MYDHVKHIEHITQNLIVYIGHKSSLLLEGKCHTHHTLQQAKLEALKVTYRQMFGPERRSPKIYTQMKNIFGHQCNR